MSLKGKRGSFSGTEMKLAFLMVFLQLTMPGYGYNIGTNVTLDFHYELSSQESSYHILASLEGVPEPFFHQNQTNTDGLRPGQAGRVDVMVEQSKRDLTINITIQELSQSDEGWYSLEVAEHTEGGRTNYVYRDYLKVTYPPEKAECQYVDGPFKVFGSDIIFVHCHAEPGHNSSVYLICLGIFYQSTVSHREDHREPVNQMLWIDTMAELQCCSSDTPDTDHNSCNDYVHTPSAPPTIPDVSPSSDKPDYSTPKTTPDYSTSKTTPDYSTSKTAPDYSTPKRTLSPSHKPDDTTPTNGVSILWYAIAVIIGMVIGACIILFNNWRVSRKKYQHVLNDTINI